MDAIHNLLSWSDLREEQHVISIFLDISGAFDNLEWPALQRDLESLGTSHRMRCLIDDYLRRRTATMSIGGVSKTVRVTKGCPQGSILGPELWNVTMEALLRIAIPEFVAIQVYADDIAISVAGPNRRSLSERAEARLVPVLAWAEERGLKFSVQKSVTMIMKGKLVPGFTIRFGEERIVLIEHAKYLGILLDQKRIFKQHIDAQKNLSETLFLRLRGTLGAG